jgi:hypothetical protein
MADSYNELFGLGTHSADANCQGQWLCQDSGGSYTIAAEIGSDLTPYVSVSTRTGPNSGYLSSAIDFNGSYDRAVKTGLSNSGDNWTLLYHAVADSTTSGSPIGIGGSAYNYWPGSPVFSNSRARVSVRDGSNWYTTVDYDPVNDSVWNHMACVISSGSRHVRVNGSNGTADTSTATIRTITSFSMGVYVTANGASNYRWHNGGVAGAAIFDRVLTDAECDEHKDGPEPLNTVQPGIAGDTPVGSTLTCDGGSWNSQSNGTVTIGYQWQRNGSDISGETSSTYTTVGADASQAITCKCTGSNDGGSDSAEATSSNTIVPTAVAGAGGYPVIHQYYQQLLAGRT